MIVPLLKWKLDIGIVRIWVNSLFSSAYFIMNSPISEHKNIVFLKVGANALLFIKFSGSRVSQWM